MSDGAETGIAAGTPLPTAAASPGPELRIEVPGLDDLKGPPRASLERAVRAYAIDVLGEASNLEAAMRADSSDQVEYTSAQVENAVVWVRNRGHVPLRKRWYPWARIGAPILFFVGGIAMPLGGAWIGWAYIGGGTGVAAVALSIVIEFAGKERR